MSDVKRGFIMSEVKEEKEIKMNATELLMILEAMECVLEGLEDRLCKSKKIVKGRKDMVLEVLMDGKEKSIGEIAQEVSVMAGVVITSKNISSQLSYLRKDCEMGILDYSIFRVGSGHGKIKLVKKGTMVAM